MGNEMMFSMANVWKMTTDDEELCKSAVKSMPKMMAMNGFSSVEMNWRKAWDSASGAMAPLMMVMPTKSMPKPKMIEPICRTIVLLTNSERMAPIKRMIGA